MYINTYHAGITKERIDMSATGILAEIATAIAAGIHPLSFVGLTIRNNTAHNTMGITIIIQEETVAETTIGFQQETSPITISTFFKKRTLFIPTSLSTVAIIQGH